MREAEKLHLRFVQEIVEAGDFCPWAKGARLHEKSRVKALWIDELLEFLIVLPNDPHQEVLQLVIPDGLAHAMRWREYVTQLERELQKRRRGLPYALAAFHPEHPGRKESLGGAIGLLRRSPLPTIQLVRLDVLDDVRKNHRLAEHVAQRNFEHIGVLAEGPMAQVHHKLLAEGRRFMKTVSARSDDK